MTQQQALFPEEKLPTGLRDGNGIIAQQIFKLLRERTHQNPSVCFADIPL
jgi:hypothetical protein